jgi:hypothetical protein
MASQSVLQILIQAIDESAAAFQGVQNNLKQTSQDALTMGTQLGVMAAGVDAAYGGIVSAAAEVQESQDSLKQAVTDAMAGASTSTGAYQTQVSFLKDKIAGYKASIAEATATLDTHTGSVEKSSAAHAKAAATIATAQENIEKYQQQLDLLTNSQDLNGQSIDDITAKLETQAESNVSLGYSVADSTKSLAQAFTATKNVSQAMQVNQAAMDLARAKNIDLATATNQVILAMNGQGRALATYGIQIKDGLSGMAALQAVQGAVNGQAEDFANTLNGQLAVGLASVNKLFSDMGDTQLPMLQKIFAAVIALIGQIDTFVEKHQKLTEVVLVAVAALGALLTVLSTLLIVVGTVGLAISLLGGPLIIIIALVVALATVVATNWDTIKTKTEEIWNFIATFLKTTWTVTGNVIRTTLADIQGLWNAAWTDMGNVVSTIWTTIQNTVKTGVDYVIQAINAFINALDALHISIPAISLPGTKLSTPAVNIGFSIPNIPMLAEGGFVTSPTLALIGEAGPEAVVPLSSMGGGNGFGGPQIIVNIQGGNYLDSQGAKMIGDSLAKQIIQQIKTRNYAL